MKVVIHTVWPVKFWECPGSQVVRLRERFPGITFAHALNEAEGVQAIGDAEIALSSSLTPAMAQCAVKLKWVHSTASAVGNLPLETLSKRGVIVTNSRGIQAVPIAEHVMAGLLVVTRRLDVMLAAQRERRWIQNEIGGELWPRTLSGKRMTIVGLGTIGLEIARRAAAFGMRVTGIRRRLEEQKPSFVERVLSPAGIDESLQGCDVLVVAAPFLQGTDRLIDERRLRLLNPAAIVINVARGRIVDERALIGALESRRLGGAVLDVFEEEPLNPASPLWALPNVVVTPHCSGCRSDHWEDVINLFSENLQRFQRGEPLLNPVDLQAGY